MCNESSGAPGPELDDSPTHEETLFLARQINEFNFETTGIRDGRELMIRSRDSESDLVILPPCVRWVWLP